MKRAAALDDAGRPSALVCLGAGIGNVVLGTPLLVALDELGFDTDLFLAADYAQTASLLQPWKAVRRVFTRETGPPPMASYAKIAPALPPFYHRHYSPRLGNPAAVVPRPPDALFYQDEQEFYLWFARALGYPAGRRPWVALPICPAEDRAVTARTLVLAPGCKTGEMAAKRWPHFAKLAQAFEDVILVGTLDDFQPYHAAGGAAFPPHVRSCVGRLTLRQTAELMASAGAVVANDSGLAHVAAAVGVPTIMLFGPTPDRALGQMPPNVTVLRQGLPCEPCWFKTRFQACAGRMTCLAELSVETVIEVVAHTGLQPRGP